MLGARGTIIYGTHLEQKVSATRALREYIVRLVVVLLVYLVYFHRVQIKAI